MKSADIRKSFLDYFASKGHTVASSSPLVPHGDPTLLFTNAGMVQFKDVFLGERKLSYSRAATSQKCLRVSGKHNDLENVGYTSRHHTFFEMLGNFSFGDYFKREACAFAWEYLTEVLKLDKSKLWVTVFETDDEAEKIWREEVGVATGRILRFGEKDNFWSMGPTGPCGPCSEILYDRGPDYNPQATSPANDTGGERYMEIWNLVFMQYNRDDSGKMTPLPRPSIDTGMGLERLTSVLQGVRSNYDTDLFQTIIQATAKMAGVSYGPIDEHNISLRVIGDHARAGAFLVADGIVPENEGRGYVLRRVLRRAIRHGRRLGFDRPFLHESCQVVVDAMGAAYPELLQRRDYIREVIENEERNFLATIDRGMGLLEEETGKVRSAKGKVLGGEVAFKLYDTYGFPLDLTQVILQEQGMAVDEAGFDAAMARQRELSRAGSNIGKTGVNKALYEQAVSEGITTRFTGYASLKEKSPVARILADGKVIQSAKAGQVVELLTATSPFYAESGGQLGDHGLVLTATGRAEVEDVQKGLPNLWVHRVKVETGTIEAGQEAEWIVDSDRRRATMSNHSATHLLHSALRNTLGGHIKQAGSQVGPETLRFDFNHMSALSPQEIASIESDVNAEVLKNYGVSKEEMPLDDAIASGAMALFDEKYGDKVRVVTMGEYSKELCGGTHVERTGDVGPFMVLREEAVAAGVRRIEALAGPSAVRRLQSQRDLLKSLSQSAGVPAEQIGAQIETLRARIKDLERENKKLRLSGGSVSVDQLAASAVPVNGFQRLAAQVDLGEDPTALRELGDKLRDKLPNSVIMLACPGAEKVRLLIIVSKGLQDRYKAGALMKAVTEAAGGRGGGKPDMAEGGISETARIPDAIKKLEELVG